MKRKSGEKINCSLNGSRYLAYLPYPLPPTPAILLDSEIEDLRDMANRALVH